MYYIQVLEFFLYILIYLNKMFFLLITDSHPIYNSTWDDSNVSPFTFSLNGNGPKQLKELKYINNIALMF